MYQDRKTFKNDLTIVVSVLEALQANVDVAVDLQELVGIAVRRLEPYLGQPLWTHGATTVGL